MRQSCWGINARSSSIFFMQSRLCYQTGGSMNYDENLRRALESWPEELGGYALEDHCAVWFLSHFAETELGIPVESIVVAALPADRGSRYEHVEAVYDHNLHALYTVNDGGPVGETRRDRSARVKQYIIDTILHDA